MLSELQIYFNALPHPDAGTIKSGLEAWGQVIIRINSGFGSQTLLDWQWDIIAICRWYIENIDMIFETTLPDIRENESIAEALERMNDRDFGEDEEDEEFNWYSMLQEFKRHHSLRFALRGAPIPDIIIGRNQSYGEISFSKEEKKWAYSFDVEKFCRGVKEEFRKFFTQWHTTTSSSKTKKLSHRLLEELGAL